MKNPKKKESIKNQKPSLKERLQKSTKKNAVSAAEYEENLEKSKIKSGIPCAF